MAGIIRKMEVSTYRKGYPGSVRFLPVSVFSVLSGICRFFFRVVLRFSFGILSETDGFLPMNSGLEYCFHETRGRCWNRPVPRRIVRPGLLDLLVKGNKKIHLFILMRSTGIF
jgi:hypothetical protein